VTPKEMAAANGGPAVEEPEAGEAVAAEEPEAVAEVPSAAEVAEDPAHEVLSQGEVTAEAAEPAEVFSETAEEESA
jgi:hypothetical protein